ncbi:MAG: histone deacetylase [Desulfomonilaceae bacterium]|nr:histone deacetylase [Desulfomonilaceae bacterium]
MKPTGIVRDPVYLQHDMGSFHPESPERLRVIYEMIDQSPLKLNLTEIPVRQATIDELSDNHDRRYVERIAATEGRLSTFLDPDTSTCAYSWEAASKAVGGIFNLLDAMMDGRIRNGFALVRPPGHHAEHHRAMGFCLFNNVALAARYAINGQGMERVAVVDWDLHHGNGTQNSFYTDPKVLFLSTHQFPHYPGTGRIAEVGNGPGEGFTVNVPLGLGAGDAEYVTVFHSVVAPLLEAYKPELILVSAGFDAHRNDPLGGMRLTEAGYEQMVRILMHLAKDLCSGRLVLTLEGGYDLAALRDSVELILSSLGSYDPDNESVPLEPSLDDLSGSFKSRLSDVLSTQRKYWPNLPQF